MYRSFSEFKEQRKVADFDAQVTQLCESLVKSNVSFDEFWQHVGLPTVLLSENFDNEEQLLNEFFGKLFGRGQQAPVAPPTPAEPADPRLLQRQETVNKSVQKIKQRFNVAMRDFLKSVTDDAKNNNDPYEWQVAKMFYDRLLKTAQPAIDNFAVNVTRGQGTWKKDFEKEQGAMQANQRQAMQNQLRSRYGNAGMTAGAGYWRPDGGMVPRDKNQQMAGPKEDDQGFLDMRKRIQAGYDPFRDFGATAPTNQPPIPLKRRRPNPQAPGAAIA